MKTSLFSEEWVGFLRSSVASKRWRHSLRVVELARTLLDHYPELEEPPLLGAAFLHDNAKDLPESAQRELAEAYRGTMDRVESRVPGLWHAPAGAERLHRELGLDREDPICRAVAFHSTAHSPLFPTLKGLFVADFAEVTRSYPEAEETRNQIGRRSLDDLVQRVLREKITRCLRGGRPLHPWSTEAFNELCLSDD